MRYQRMTSWKQYLLCAVLIVIGVAGVIGIRAVHDQQLKEHNELSVQLRENRQGGREFRELMDRMREFRRLEEKQDGP